MPHAARRHFCLVTLGCKVNQYESRALAEAWTRAGLAPTDDPALADLVVLCSCAVTARAEAEGRRLARNLVRVASGKPARVVVTGCAAAVSPGAFAALGAAPVPDKARLAADPFGSHTAAPRAEGVFPDLSVAGCDRARGLVKVQDGCSHGCTYCVVPAARGTSVSRPFAAILAEVRRLIEAGHREIGLTGINLGHYGCDLSPKSDFWDLVAGLDAALAPQYAGTARLRLGSLDPAMLDDRGLAVLAGSRLVCPHLHISLQSADPGTLAAMGRRPDDAATVSSFVDVLGREWPALGLGLDLLTGFPGESEAAFGATAAFLAALPATYAHVFPYSRRPGTPAAALPGQIAGPVKTERAKILRQTAEAKSAAFAARLCREPFLVVAVERTGPASGTCAQYVDCRFEAEPGAALGSLVPAKPLGVDGPVLCVAPYDGTDRP